MQCDKNPEKIKTIFDRISPYYDLMNNLISFGTHYLIKISVLKSLEIKPGSDVLDLCCGSGDFTKIISRRYKNTKVIGVDFSSKMLEIAKKKNPGKIFIQADATNLPFQDSEFEYVTMGFGLRNIENRDRALSEIYRVLKPGGKFLQLDFGEHNRVSKIFNIIVPTFAQIFGKDYKSYEYLINSKEDFPPPKDLINEYKTHGFKLVKSQKFLFGAIAVQIMEK